MNTKLLILLTSIILASCASQSSYKPATGAGYGYHETAISENRYRVKFKARDDNPDQARDYALLRAAELTLLKGYDWFVIVDRETRVDREHTSPHASMRNSQTTTKSCGLLGCTTTTQPTTSYEVGVGHSSARSDTSSILEIRLGKGVRPAGQDSYDALEVSEKLQPAKS